MIEKYVLTPDGSALTLNSAYQGATRFGGVEYYADHDYLFGSEHHGFGDIGICMLLFMEDISTTTGPSREIENLTKLDIANMQKKSRHIEEAVDEIQLLVNLSRYYSAKGMISRKAEKKCPWELKFESRTAQ